jgi:hypothetical protein
MKNKNLILGIGLIGLAFIIYNKNKKEGVLTAGVDSGMSNMCGSCNG